MFLFFQLALCSLPALLTSSITGVSGNAAACGSLEVTQTAPSNEQVANDSSLLELRGAAVSLTCVCTGDSSNPVSWYNRNGDVVGNGGMLEVASLDGNAIYECRESDPLFHLVNLVAVDISVSPPTQVVSVGADAVFTCVDTPTGAGTFTYQWELDGADIFDGADFSGTGTSDLTIGSAQISDSGTYTCVATLNGVTQSATGNLTVKGSGTYTCTVTTLREYNDGRGEIIGSPVTASVTILGADVTVHPVDQTNIVPGSDVSFIVTATGTAPLSYQWQKDGADLTDGNRITGATTATLTITGVMESDEGGYRCVVTNIAGMDISNTATLTVADPPQVTVHPVDQTNIVLGRDASFSVTATGTAPLRYQWQKDGVDLTVRGSITGAYTATLAIIDVMESDEGGYRCVVTNSLGMDISSTAMLTVAPPPSVTIQHTGMSIAGQQYKLTCTVVKAEGVREDPTVQWRGPDGSVVERDSNIILDGPHTFGTTSTLTLTLNPLVPSHGGGYACQAGFGSPETSSQSTTHVIVTSSAAFQVKLGPVEYCIYWSEHKAEKVEVSIQQSLASYITQTHCACDSVAKSMYNGVFSCQNTSIAVVYKAIVSVNSTNCNCTATELVSLIGEWAESEGTVQVGKIQLRADKSCPTMITSLDDKECAQLISSHGVPDSYSTCTYHCLARMIPYNLCGN